MTFSFWMSKPRAFSRRITVNNFHCWSISSYGYVISIERGDGLNTPAWAACPCRETFCTWMHKDEQESKTVFFGDCSSFGRKFSDGTRRAPGIKASKPRGAYRRDISYGNFYTPSQRDKRNFNIEFILGASRLFAPRNIPCVFRSCKIFKCPPIYRSHILWESGKTGAERGWNLRYAHLDDFVTKRQCDTGDTDLRCISLISIRWNHHEV